MHYCCILMGHSRSLTTHAHKLALSQLHAAAGCLLMHKSQEAKRCNCCTVRCIRPCCRCSSYHRRGEGRCMCLQLRSHACMCLQLRSHACMCLQIRSHACMCLQLHSHTCMCLQLHSHACMCHQLHSHACVCLQLHSHACVCLQLHSHACVCLQLRSHACMCLQLHSHACPLCSMQLQATREERQGRCRKGTRRVSRAAGT